MLYASRKVLKYIATKYLIKHQKSVLVRTQNSELFLLNNNFVTFHLVPNFQSVKRNKEGKWDGAILSKITQKIM